MFKYFRRLWNRKEIYSVCRMLWNKNIKTCNFKTKKDRCNFLRNSFNLIFVVLFRVFFCISWHARKRHYLYFSAERILLLTAGFTRNKEGRRQTRNGDMLVTDQQNNRWQPNFDASHLIPYFSVRHEAIP